jgi:hypothetical protein
MLAVLPVVALCSTKGYHTFAVKHDRPFAVILNENILVVALDEVPPPYVNFTVVDRKNQTTAVPMSTFSHILFFKTTIFVSVVGRRVFSLHYWLIPTTVCSAVSYSAIADHQLTFRLQSDNARSDFCIFSQSGAGSYSAILDYHSEAPRPRVEFWTQSTGPARRCKRGRLCEFRSSRPFFLRVANITDAAFHAAITFWAFRWAVDSSECSMKPIPFLVEPPIQIPMGVMSVAGIQCVSMAEDVLRYTAIVLCVGAVGVAVLCALHWSGYINLRATCGCTREGDRFRDLKENPYAEPLPAIGVVQVEKDT